MGLLPRLRSPLLVLLLLLVHTSLAVILTNTEYNLQIGVPFTITWAEAAGPVRIDLYGGDDANTLFEIQAIAASVAGTSFIWTPADVPQRNAYAILVSDGSTANAISFAFTFNAAQTTTSTSTTPPTTTSTTAPPTTTSSSTSNTLTTTSSRPFTAATVSSNSTITTPTNTVPTSAPTGPPTAAADVVNNVPGAQRGDTGQVLSTAAKVGIGLAAGVGVIAIIAGSVIMIIKKNKQYDQDKELEDGSGGEGAGLGKGGSSPELGMGGWKTAEKRPEGAAIEMAPRSSLTGLGAGPGPDVGRAATPVASRPVTPGANRPATPPAGRLTPGRPATPNAPRTPSPLANEVNGPPRGVAR